MSSDTVIVRLQPDRISGQNCAIYFNGYKTTLKRVIQGKDGLLLQLLNPEYPPKKYEYPKVNEYDYEPYGTDFRHSNEAEKKDVW